MGNIYIHMLYRYGNKLLQIFNCHYFKFGMIKYLLSSNQLVTAPTWVAKEAEMTGGFSPPDGNPMALGCLKQTLVTGDFHQLCVLPFKICNNIAFNSPNFFLMNVRRPCTFRLMGWVWRGGRVFLFISNWAILKK